jgi:hypothetical protein
MTELTRQHHDLAPMVTLVRGEVREDMSHVQRQVAPDVTLRGRDVASGRQTELEQRFDPVAAPLQRGKQCPSRDLTAIDRGGDGDSMFTPECSDPHAPGVVKVPGDHAHRPPRRSGNRGVPECGGQLLDEVCGDPAVGSPGGQERRAEIGGRDHLYQRMRTFTAARLRNANGADPPGSAAGAFDASYNVVRPGISASIPVPIAE